MSGHTRRFFPEPVAAKVPEITFLFWVIKVLTTAGGEATSDYLALDLGSRLVAGCIEAGIFVVALVWQFRTRRYFAPAYWALAYSIAIFGTGVADAMHLFVGIPYAGTTVLWAVVLALVFWLWYRSERTLTPAPAASSPMRITSSTPKSWPVTSLTRLASDVNGRS